MLRPVIAIAATIVIAPVARAQMGPVGAPARPPASSAPPILKQVGIDQKLGGQVPLDLEFRDEAGKTVRLGDYFGKRPVVLSLVYYQCPMLCTMALNGQLRAMRAISMNAGKEFEVVTVSFDPKETPQLARAKKATYIRQYDRAGAEASWHFLTGDAASIEKLTQAVGFRYKYDPNTQQYAHASGIIIASPTGSLDRYLLGVEYAPRDLQMAVMEASQEKVGTKTDQILLYCYHYDPATGRYGVAVMRLVRTAGALTVLALASFVTLMIRRERRLNPKSSLVGPASSRSDRQDAGPTRF